MREIAEARAARPELRLVLGHGSGSFGHVEAKKYGTREGVRTDDQWRGFAEVQWVAAQLNRLVVDAAREAGLPVMNLPPSASAFAREAVIESLAIAPIRAALDHALVPVVQGDVAFDSARGGTIISTEDVFRYLAPRLRPARILLAGIERGVLTHWPEGDLIPELHDVPATVVGAYAADVTGGMAAKVRETLTMIASAPGCDALIFSGEEPGHVQRALLGERVPGTLVNGQQ
jgi:isopentenyl phosphate kinase